MPPFAHFKEKGIQGAKSYAVEEVGFPSSFSAEDQARMDKAEEILNRDLSAEEMAALIQAHEVGEGELGTDGGPARIGYYTDEQLQRKYNMLAEAGLTKDEIKILMDEGIVGSLRLGYETLMNGFKNDEFKIATNENAFDLGNFYVDRDAAEIFATKHTFDYKYLRTKLQEGAGLEFVMELGKGVTENEIMNAAIIDEQRVIVKEITYSVTMRGITKHYRQRFKLQFGQNPIDLGNGFKFKLHHFYPVNKAVEI